LIKVATLPWPGRCAGVRGVTEARLQAGVARVDGFAPRQAALVISARAGQDACMSLEHRSTAATSECARYPSLQSRHVLISGGATGIGASLVEQFAAQGAQVGFVDRDPAGAELAARLASQGCTVRFAVVDVTDTPAYKQAIAQLRAELGPVRVLVNNAANDARHTLDEVDDAYWDRAVAVNLKHAYFAAQAVAADMKAAGGGSIINFGSVSWMLKMPGMPVYTTAKSAVQGLTKTLARLLGPDHIRVNSIVPGWVRTDKQRQLWRYDERQAETEALQCIPAPLLPEHIAHMALFLAADDSAMCTAQDFVVDGGWT
jgi:D-xylose 1-dehydrogenase